MPHVVFGLDPCYRRRVVAASTTRRLASGLALAALLGAGCFDSDETFEPRAGTTTGEPDPTTTGIDGTSSSGGLDPTTGEPEFTCRDAVACMNACAVDLVLNPTPEPDLGCLLDCVEDNLTVRETYNLLQLSNCVADVCEQQAECMPESSTDTDAGDTDTDGTTGGGGDGGGDEGGIIDPCLGCIFEKLNDDDPQECQEFHTICDEMDEE